jgi:hypothetical protein
MEIRIDKDKHDRMVRDMLMLVRGAHPAEIVLALGEAIGRVIAEVAGSDVVKTQLVNVAVKQMATAIEHAPRNESGILLP